MADTKKLKDVTYSSEYVDRLETKLALARKENVRLKHEKMVFECTSSFYLEVYKQALKQAIGDAMPYVDEWSLMIAEVYEEYAELFRECIKDKSSIEDIAMFYFMLVAKNKDKEEWSKRK